MNIKMCVLYITLFVLLFCFINFFVLNEKQNKIHEETTQQSMIIDYKNSAVIKTPKYLYIITSKEVWETSKKNDKLILPSHHDEFIHLAKDDQIFYVTKKFWSGSDYFILTIDKGKMIGRLVYEINPGGSERYFHLYDGMIPLNSVIDAVFIKSSE